MAFTSKVHSSEGGASCITHDRDVNKHMDEFAASGEILFRAMYGDTADSVQGLLDSVYPDLGKFRSYLRRIQYFTIVIIRVVVQYYWIRSYVWRNQEGTHADRKFIHHCSSTDRGRCTEASCLASTQCAERWCVIRRGQGCASDLDRNCRKGGSQVGRWGARSNLRDDHKWIRGFLLPQFTSAE